MKSKVRKMTILYWISGKITRDGGNYFKRDSCIDKNIENMTVKDF